MKRMHFIQIFGLLILINACQPKAELSDLYKDILMQNERMITILEDQIKSIERKAWDDLINLSRIKYKPILPTLDSVRHHYLIIYRQAELLGEKINTDKAKTDFIDTTQILLSKISDIHSNLLLNHGATFGLQTDHVSALREILRDSIKHQKNDWSNLKWLDLNEKESGIGLSNLKLKIKLAEYELIKKISSYYSGRVVCDWIVYVPIVNPKKCAVRIGEVYEAEISIGTYANQIDPTHLVFFVNGDTLKADDSGKATLAITSSRAGEQQLNISYSIINPLTGMTFTEDATYEYEVLPN